METIVTAAIIGRNRGGTGSASTVPVGRIGLGADPPAQKPMYLARASGAIVGPVLATSLSGPSASTVFDRRLTHSH